MGRDTPSERKGKPSPRSARRNPRSSSSSSDSDSSPETSSTSSSSCSSSVTGNVGRNEEPPPAYSRSGERTPWKRRGNSARNKDEESLLESYRESSSRPLLAPGKKKKSRRQDEDTDDEEESDETDGSSGGSSEETDKSSDSGTGSATTTTPSETEGSEDEKVTAGGDEKGKQRPIRRTPQKKKSTRGKKKQEDVNSSYLYLIGVILFLILVAAALYWYFEIRMPSTSTPGSSSGSSPVSTPQSSSQSTTTSSSSPPALGSSSSGTPTSSAPGSTGSTGSSSGVPSPLFVVYTDKAQTLPDPSDIPGFNVLMLAFWTLSEGAADNAATFTMLPSSDQTSWKSKYQAAGVKVMVSAFGSSDVPTTTKADPVGTADKVAAFVTQNDLDGVDDLGAMDLGDGSAETWLINFTTELRKKLPSPKYLISHAPLAPWFTTSTTQYKSGAYRKVHQEVGSMIDFYNLQFYNQQMYDTCDTLITTSGGAFPGTAVLEIVANGVPQNKVILGKPATSTDANSDYIDPKTLATCVTQAKAKGWKGGLMIWEYERPNDPANWVSTVWGS